MTFLWIMVTVQFTGVLVYRWRRKARTREKVEARAIANVSTVYHKMGEREDDTRPNVRVKK